MKRAIVGVVNTHRAVPFGGWVTLYPKTRGENRIRGPSGDQLDTSSEEDDEPEFKIGRLRLHKAVTLWTTFNLKSRSTV